jgi:hypothetical protein
MSTFASRIRQQQIAQAILAGIAANCKYRHRLLSAVG